MKKTYETPNVQMMAFRYRDQVVAASGDPTVPQSEEEIITGGNQWQWIYDIIKGIWERIFG